ncbi:hypothetical protein POM88_023949 [Heracleum sosnowskyi]|uniref:DUF4218 domain-containing protein n=1 Tax=Heracleum sosnowskyi TaxID=360622 RepID=A0AAD8IHY5_9APIA|nr:hypothetical protein POM88_023949 [Heracleum sosnowskyi]
MNWLLLPKFTEEYSEGAQDFVLNGFANFAVGNEIKCPCKDCGWSTKGKLGCHVCHYCTSSTYLKHSRKICYMNHRKFLHPDHKLRSDKRRFNGEIETNVCPPPLSGKDIEELLCGYENSFGKKNKKRKAVLHPSKCADNIHYEYNAANFDMTKKEKENFCSVLKNARLPYGSTSNISRCVHMDERKVFGYKSHDAHFILQYLLQFTVINTLKPEVAIPLIKLGAFFRGICGKVINLEDVHKLQEEIIEILCELETIFPPTFFDIMVHLPLHLCKEVEFGGPVHLRWMFRIERYLCKLKSYDRNKSKPEGSMAEGYLDEECLTFCSRFLSDEVQKK